MSIMIENSDIAPASPTPCKNSALMAKDKTTSPPGSKDVLPEIQSSSSVLDNTKPLPTSLQSDFLPEEVLFALTQIPTRGDQLPPPSRIRSLNCPPMPTRKRTDNAWYHNRRNKFKHLTENTICICGAGRDISFLYDVAQTEKKTEKTSKFDPSSVRVKTLEEKKKTVQLSKSVIPEEYHIVKNQGVLTLEYHEDKYAVHPEDHAKHLVQFPSLKPTSRLEVVKLKSTLTDMLEKAGINDQEVEIKGPTQLHNLLELIKKEQNIYNIIFHEVIRQVSVECTERGELLAEIRTRYNDLLNKVPQQIKSLHEEVMAQRTLDRRLTEELLRFKKTISILTDELTEVTEHDMKITKEAQETRCDLKRALNEAEKNANVLSEFHDLYELQRQRLEQQITNLVTEKDIWCMTTYNIAIKVIHYHHLTTAKRLQVCEKTWDKLANHFTILVSDKDSEMLTDIQSRIDQWCANLEDFNFFVLEHEQGIREETVLMRDDIDHSIMNFKENYLTFEGDLLLPDKTSINKIRDKLLAWIKITNEKIENFTGDVILTSQKQMKEIERKSIEWTDSVFVIFQRHKPSPSHRHLQQEAFKEMDEHINNIIDQYKIRMTGENGLVSILVDITEVLDPWDKKLKAESLSESDMIAYYHLLNNLVILLDKFLDTIGKSNIQESESKEEEKMTNFSDVVKDVQCWFSLVCNAINSEDSKLADEVTKLHTDMIKWMSQMLIHLAQNYEDTSNEMAELMLLTSPPISNLHKDSIGLFSRLHATTNKIIRAVEKILEVLQQLHYSADIFACSIPCEDILSRSQHELLLDNATEEMTTLKQIRMETQFWIETAKILFSQLTNQCVDELFPVSVRNKSSESFQSSTELENEEEIAWSSLIQADGLDMPVGEEEVDSKSYQVENEQTLLESKQADEKENDEVEYLAFDGNTHLQKLHYDQTFILPKTPAEFLLRLETPDTKNAYEAVALVTDLQQKLICTEQRAQESEERALAAEVKLLSCQEKLWALEKKLLESSKFPEQKGIEKPTRNEFSEDSDSDSKMSVEMEKGNKKAAVKSARDKKSGQKNSKLKKSDK